MIVARDAALIRALLFEEEYDVRAKPKIILNSGCPIRKLRAEPVGFNCPDGYVMREHCIDAAAGEHRESVRVCGGSSGCWKETVESVGHADETLTKDRQLLVHGCPGLARPEGRGHHVESHSGGLDVADVRTANIRDNT